MLSVNRNHSVKTNWLKQPINWLSQTFVSVVLTFNRFVLTSKLRTSVGTSKLRTSVKKFQKALACYAELNHLFQLELLPISIKL
jgi:hypothetical protein